MPNFMTPTPDATPTPAPVRAGARLRRLHPYRRLIDAPLTKDDWHAVYLAQQSFIYQIQRIVAAAEDRTREARNG